MNIKPNTSAIYKSYMRGHYLDHARKGYTVIVDASKIASSYRHNFDEIIRDLGINCVKFSSYEIYLFKTVSDFKKAKIHFRQIKTVPMSEMF